MYKKNEEKYKKKRGRLSKEEEWRCKPCRRRWNVVVMESNTKKRRKGVVILLLGEKKSILLLVPFSFFEGVLE